MWRNGCAGPFKRSREDPPQGTTGGERRGRVWKPHDHRRAASAPLESCHEPGRSAPPLTGQQSAALGAQRPSRAVGSRSAECRMSGRRPRGHRNIESWAAPDAQRLARAAGELSRGTCSRRTLVSCGCRRRPNVSRTLFDHPIARQDRGHSCAAPSSQWRAPLSVSVLNGRRRVAPRSESHVQSVMLRVSTVRIKLYVHVYLDTDRTPSGLGTQHVGRAVQPAGIAARAATAVAHEQTGSASIAACCRASCLKKMGLT